MGGCISSRLLPTTRIYCPNHVVSLTSTTYGQLNLYPPQQDAKQQEEEFGEVISQEETPEVINSWELMQDLDDEIPIPKSQECFSPLFDPELIAFYDGELFEEAEQIKQVISEVSNLEKCPPGGQNKVVLYTTSIRGIRKTFEDCNAVRSLFESYDVRVAERDISIDSGFREELRMLVGKKDVRAPVAFVKGRLVGGAEEVMRLEAEGKLGWLLEGLPAAAKWCGFCGGIKFLMCSSCNGSKKVWNEKKRLQRCGDCNENGIVHCHKCC